MKKNPKNNRNPINSAKHHNLRQLKFSYKTSPGEIPRRPAMEGGGVFLDPSPYASEYYIALIQALLYIFL